MPLPLCSHQIRGSLLANASFYAAVVYIVVALAEIVGGSFLPNLLTRADMILDMYREVVVMTLAFYVELMCKGFSYLPPWVYWFFFSLNGSFKVSSLLGGLGGAHRCSNPGPNAFHLAPRADPLAPDPDPDVRRGSHHPVPDRGPHPAGLQLLPEQGADRWASPLLTCAFTAESCLLQL